MMILKLMPETPMLLDISAYYHITLVKLEAGDSNITSCTLHIGDEKVFFRESDEKGVLTVDGVPGNQPTIIIKPNTEATVLLVPHDKSADYGEVLLHHMLSYSVPKLANAKSA